MAPELKILFSREQIAARVAELGQQISRDFTGEPVVLVGVLKGAAIFLSDLARHIELDSTFDFIAVSSYADQKQHSGEVKLLKDVEQSMEDKNIILVEDILDTGLTLTYLKQMLLARHPRAFESPPCWTSQAAASRTSMRITQALKFPMSLWLAMAWIMPNGTGICRIFACSLSGGARALAVHWPELTSFLRDNVGRAPTKSRYLHVADSDFELRLG